MTTVHSGMSFNLIDVPWILVQRRDGPVEEVSLLDLFARAHELRGVVGEVPTQTFAITRLLLAILRRALDGPRTIEDWARWWRAPTLPIDEVRTYLEHFRHRFDLLSPETPFYQVADLRTAKGEFSGLEKLIADVPVGAPYFTTRLGSGSRGSASRKPPGGWCTARPLIHLVSNPARWGIPASKAGKVTRSAPAGPACSAASWSRGRAYGRPCCCTSSPTPSWPTSI